MKGNVDKYTCIGCGLCVGICPEIFEMDQDGRAVAKDIELDSEQIISVAEAEKQCPSSAISMEK